MIFDIKHSDHKVRTGYTMASAVLLSGEFHEMVEKVERFTYAKAEPASVKSTLIDCLRISPGLITVEPWYYRNSEVVATTFRKKPRQIFVNSNGLSFRSPVVYLENGIHEFGHTPMGFSHGTNYPPGSRIGWILGDREDKNLSVPHTLARLGVEFARSKGWL